MARQRREKEVKVKLRQPDRSGPDPSHESLLDLAEKRGLLKAKGIGEKATGYNEPNEEEPLVGRLAESFLWSISLAMLHFTLDVLVSHQYAVEIVWPQIIGRAAKALPSKLPDLGT